jgi:hypothetical protein
MQKEYYRNLATGKHTTTPSVSQIKLRIPVNMHISMFNRKCPRKCMYSCMQKREVRHTYDPLDTFRDTCYDVHVVLQWLQYYAVCVSLKLCFGKFLNV